MSLTSFAWLNFALPQGRCRSNTMALGFTWLLTATLQALQAAPESELGDSPRYSADSRYIQDITARPGPLSVTESIALPPQPNGRLDVKVPRIRSS